MVVKKQPPKGTRVCLAHVLVLCWLGKLCLALFLSSRGDPGQRSCCRLKAFVASCHGWSTTSSWSFCPEVPPPHCFHSHFISQTKSSGSFLTSHTTPKRADVSASRSEVWAAVPSGLERCGELFAPALCGPSDCPLSSFDCFSELVLSPLWSGC